MSERSSGLVGAVASLSVTMALGILPCSLAQAATVVFLDSFNNGVVQNSDSQSGYWNTDSSGTVNFSESTSGGGLAVSVQRPASGNSMGHLKSPVVSSDLNFFHHKVTYDCSFSYNDSTDKAGMMFWFNVVSTPNTTSYTSGTVDRLSISISPYGTGSSAVQVVKVRNANDGVGATLKEAYPVTVGRFVLSLDATNYSLAIYKADGVLASTLTGAHNLIESTWGPIGNPNQYSHNSSVSFGIVGTANSWDGTTPSSPGTASMNMKNLMITAEIPEPASLSLLAGSGALLTCRKRASESGTH